MDADLMDLYFRPMREELVRAGFRELRTPEEVDAALADDETTRFVVINSMCGCAGGIARPAAIRAIQHEIRPQELLTVFASQDREATARLRSYFPDQPPSSPSMALLKGKRLVHMIHRHQIENRDPEDLAGEL
ncbi:MAG TPA: BrxA/BrxB family bacilliredoxin, partial [Bacillota bacterium]